MSRKRNLSSPSGLLVIKKYKRSHLYFHSIFLSLLCSVHWELLATEQHCWRQHHTGSCRRCPILIRDHLGAGTPIILTGQQFLGGGICDWANGCPARVPMSCGLIRCLAGSHVAGVILCKQSCVGFSIPNRKGKPTSQRWVHPSQDESLPRYTKG